MTPRPYPYMVRRVIIGGVRFYQPVPGYPDKLTNRPAQATPFEFCGPALTTIPVENVLTTVKLQPVLRVMADIAPAALTPQQAAD